MNESLMKDTIVVNTITNAHSRYAYYPFNRFFTLNGKHYGTNIQGIYELTGEKDFVGEDNETDIDAFCVTPSTDFNEDKKKSIKDAYIYGRFKGEMNIDLYVEEGEVKEGYAIPYDNNDGVHRRRCKIPSGLRGTAWKFKVKNVDGCDFNLFNLEVSAKNLKRTV